MDYLTQLFLELEETEKQETALPDVAEALHQTASLRPGHPTDSDPGSLPPKRAQETFPAGQLSRLLETAQKAQWLTARGTVSASKAQNGAIGTSMPGAGLPAEQAFPLAAAETLTPETFSRFFERDARRY